MLISHKHKFITIDIPKTGTRSLRESLVPLEIIDTVGAPNESAEFYQHDTAECAHSQFIKNNWKWEDYYSFTIVRNPWQRYFSFFKYFKSYAGKYKNKDSSIAWNQPEINQGKMCLEMFEKQDEKTIMRNLIKNNKPQHEYYIINNQAVINHIAEFENLQNEFTLLCDQVDITPPALEHGNKSPNLQNMHEIYNQELIDLVAQKEKHVIQLKGYEY